MNSKAIYIAAKKLLNVATCYKETFTMPENVAPLFNILLPAGTFFVDPCSV